MPDDVRRHESDSRSTREQRDPVPGGLVPMVRLEGSSDQPRHDGADRITLQAGYLLHGAEYVGIDIERCSHVITSRITHHNARILRGRSGVSLAVLAVEGENRLPPTQERHVRHRVYR